jgi:TolB-like protein/Flp pilus assembly protein TadD
MTELSHAVFLSYASQDAEAAQRICGALRAAGVEVWFDQSELRGGDAWDQSIRRQIKTCALFLPIISKQTQERAEGYFRLEWKLAIDRSHLIMASKAFLVPVVIDDTADDDENVPEKFREVQWTRMPVGQTPPEFVTRIHQLLSGESSDTPAPRPAAVSSGRVWRLKPPWLVVAVVLAALAAYLLAEKPWTVKPTPPSKPAASADTPMRFNPPPHSIAVLPFVNMSGDKDQEYFSDGLSEELLNSLARINELQVAARTSSFYFKGEHADLSTIAHKLNVASVLEGSVRRSGNTIRITAQLNNAVTGYHLWSETYDRDLKDVLKLQSEIATAVASALKITLLGDVAAKIEVGGTRNPAAFDAYVRALRVHYLAVSAKDEQAAIDGFSQALRLDPDYALAYAGRSLAYSSGTFWATTATLTLANLDRALADARKTVALAPAITEGHVALAAAYEASLEFTRADEEYERALTLSPGNARVLRDYGNFAVSMGRSDSGLAMLRRAADLDPLNYSSHMFLGGGLQALHRYHEAMVAFSDALALSPDSSDAHTSLGMTQYLLEDPQAAHASCGQAAEEYDYRAQCMAIADHKLGRHADAQAALTKVRARWGDGGPTVYAQVYAQWGDTTKALEWLDTAVRLRSPGLESLKTDPLLDPLRNEPRFQAIERELKFPN